MLFQKYRQRRLEEKVAYYRAVCDTLAQMWEGRLMTERRELRLIKAAVNLRKYQARLERIKGAR